MLLRLTNWTNGTWWWRVLLLYCAVQAKGDVDRLLDRLERLNPHPTPLRQAATGGLPQASPLLLGDWELVGGGGGGWVGAKGRRA